MDESNGCGEYTERTVISWLLLGGRRLDCANSYGNSKSVGRAMKMSNIARSQIFLTEKVGPPPNVSLGYADTLIQVDQLLRDLQTDYMDLLLIHEPVGDIPQSADPYCRIGSPVYTEKACRLSTWRAMVKVWQEGKALAIGVSNWNVTHLQELVDAGLPLPSVNQCPFHLYKSSTQQALRDYCASKDILFHGYSGLGAPDVFVFPPTVNGAPSGMAYIELVDPTVLKIAEAHNRTAAQVLINWQATLGLPTNVRSQNLPHMRENLESYDFTLSADELKTLSSSPQAPVGLSAKPVRPTPTPRYYSRD